MDYQKILDAAYAAANKAQEGQIDRLACGFAWVTIDGRSPLAAFCRKKIREAGARLEGREKRIAEQNAEQFYGSKGAIRGWQFWKPGSFQGQSIDVHEMGARAFRDVLAENGYSAEVGSRLD